MPRRAAYTLIELVVVIAVLGVVCGFLFYALQASASAYIDLRHRSANVADAQFALELMSKEIREIRSASDGDLPTHTASALGFTDAGGTSIAYSYGSGTLSRNGFTLLNRLTAFAFAYKKADGTAATDASDIWTIEVTMTLARSGKTLSLRTRIFPRGFTGGLTSWQTS